MSGHSKWATIKHKKGAADAARGKVFNKLARQVEVAAKGGGDPEMNATLRTAVQKAKSASMPNDAIERAIKRGTGEGSEGVVYETIMYEGYAPGGVALLIDVLTDNRNRISADVRQVFTKLGGSMAEPGAVGWQFARRGVIVTNEGVSEDDVMLAALDAGADDIIAQGEAWRIDDRPVGRLRRAGEAPSGRHRDRLGRLADGRREPHRGDRAQGREGDPANHGGARGQRRCAGRVLELRHQ